MRDALSSRAGKMKRRTLLKVGAAASLSGASLTAASRTAAGYARARGANERIGVGSWVWAHRRLHRQLLPKPT
jgi:hypothetical protein